MVNKSRLLIVFWLALAVLGLALCYWQLGRAQEKSRMTELRQARSEVLILGEAPGQTAGQTAGRSIRFSGEQSADSLDQQRVLLSGKWLLDKTIFLDNRAFEGRAGVHVLTPLLLSDQSMIWVNRGWMEKPPGITKGLSAPVAPAAQNLSAVTLSSVMKRIELTTDPSQLRQGAVWQNFDWQASRQWLTSPVWPVIAWQADDNGDGLVRKIPEVTSDVPKHLGYAAQWFLLTLVALFFAWRMRRKT